MPRSRCCGVRVALLATPRVRRCEAALSRRSNRERFSKQQKSCEGMLLLLSSVAEGNTKWGRGGTGEPGPKYCRTQIMPNIVLGTHCIQPDPSPSITSSAVFRLLVSVTGSLESQISRLSLLGLHAPRNLS